MVIMIRVSAAVDPETRRAERRRRVIRRRVAARTKRGVPTVRLPEHVRRPLRADQHPVAVRVREIVAGAARRLDDRVTIRLASNVRLSQGGEGGCYCQDGSSEDRDAHHKVSNGVIVVIPVLTTRCGHDTTSRRRPWDSPACGWSGNHFVRSVNALPPERPRELSRPDAPTRDQTCPTFQAAAGIGAGRRRGARSDLPGRLSPEPRGSSAGRSCRRP